MTFSSLSQLHPCSKFSWYWDLSDRTGLMLALSLNCASATGGDRLLMAACRRSRTASSWKRNRKSQR